MKKIMANPRNLSEVSMENRRDIKSIAFLSKSTNRTAIARITGLSFPVVTKNINELIALGFLRENSTPQKRKGSGRIAAEIEVNPDYGWSIGFELGPYRIMVTVMDAAGKEEESLVLSNGIPERYEDLLCLLSSFIGTERSKRKGRLLGVGISSPGCNEEMPGCLYRFDYPDWDGHDIERDLSKASGVPVLLMNNVSAMALYYNLTNDLEDGHYAFFFAYRGIASVEFDHFSNGLGNRINRSGQVGHMVMELGGDACPSCGNHGCLESISSEPAIYRKCLDWLRKNGEGTEGVSFEDILERRKKDKRCFKDVFDRAFIFLGVAIANIQNYCHVRKMVISSRIIQDDEDFGFIEEVVRDNLLAAKYIRMEFVREGHDLYYGSRSAAFCFLYDQYVGIGERLL